MSDMIDRLRKISHSAGRDAAVDLTTPSTIAGLAERVRYGVRRRRIRIGAIGASVAAIVGAAALAAPTLLRALPSDEEDLQPGIVRTVGPITTYDDDSVSVVLSSGEVVGLPIYDGDVVFQQPSSEELCAVASPDNLPSGTWTPTTVGANRILDQTTLWDKEDDGTRSPIMSGSSLGTIRETEPISVFASVQVDPAVAPFIAIRMSSWEFQVLELDDGTTSYYTVSSKSILEGEPEPVYSGSADQGTRIGTLETRTATMDQWSGCYMYVARDHKAPGVWKESYLGYVVVDVFLVDHKGGSYPLGTAAYWYEYEMSE